MRVALGADHAGLALKNELSAALRIQGFDILDLGAHEYQAQDDYPDFAFAVAEAVAARQADRGIVVCGSGVGASVAANKIRGVRAALCHDTYSAHQGVEHDDLNVLCLGSRIIGSALAQELVAAFLQARFSGEERHQRRLDKVLAADERSAAGRAAR
jgi:ribose 5-phosphate isomerase B